MKHLLFTLLSAVITSTAFAQVPSLINYQGRLTDANGAPVTGTKNFTISIYDTATGTNLLYTESIGAVTLDTNGVYSFQFGSAGVSNTLVTETLAIADGTATTFQKILEKSPVVANSVSVADGTYTWSQSAGSSNDNNFGVAYSTSLRRVTVNYYAEPPVGGMAITATYRYETSGISGALSSGAEHWMAVAVDGTAQGTRQRILAVPFAMVASKAINSPKLKPRVSVGTSGTADSDGYLIAGPYTLGNPSYPSTYTTSITRVSGEVEDYPRNLRGDNAAPITIPVNKGDQWSGLVGSAFFLRRE